MMPRIRITELLHEVAQETGFLAAFTNLRTGERCPNENALLATILADATNLGLSRMAAASQGVTRDQLLWTHAAYSRDDSYPAAPAVQIERASGKERVGPEVEVPVVAVSFKKKQRKK